MSRTMEPVPRSGVQDMLTLLAPLRRGSLFRPSSTAHQMGANAPAAIQQVPAGVLHGVPPAQHLQQIRAQRTGTPRNATCAWQNGTG
jgi:hypothetical protein